MSLVVNSDAVADVLTPLVLLCSYDVPYRNTTFYYLDYRTGVWLTYVSANLKGQARWQLGMFKVTGWVL